jgi:hypothetical protein
MRAKHADGDSVNDLSAWAIGFALTALNSLRAGISENRLLKRVGV